MKNSIEEDIKIVEKLINAMKSDRTTFKEETSREIYTFFINSLENILSDYKRVLKELEEKTTILLAGAEKVKQLEKENEELKKDISNMYDEEVIISIISNNFNLSRNEVLELLGGE